MAEEKLIGTQPHQVPRNADLGDLAYQNGDGANINSLTIGNLKDNPTWTHNMTPSRPNTLLDFKNSESVHPNLRWRRNSPGYHFDKAGRYVKAMPNTARIDYDPHTGECLGLLNEPPSTNAMPYSWRSTQWDRQATDIDQSITNVAPDGISDCWLVKQQATNARHAISDYALSTQTSGQKNCWEFWLKPYSSSGAAPSNFYIEMGGQGAQYSGFSLYLNGGDPYVSTEQYFRWSDLEYYEDTGWYRFRWGTTASDNGTPYLYVAMKSDADQLVYTGNTNHGIFLWGLNLKLNESNPTSGIETDGAQATRLGDYGTMTLDDLDLQVYGNQKPITLFAQATPTNVYGIAAEQTASAGGIAGFMSTSQGSEGRIQLRSNHSIDKTGIQIIISNAAASSTDANIIDYDATAYDRTETFKSAVTIANNDVYLYSTRNMKDITAIGSDTSVTPVLYDSQGRPNYFVVGWAASNFGHFNGHIEKLALWNRRLSNDVLSKLVEI